MRKPNSIIVLLYIFHIIHPQKQKPSIQPFCYWGEHSKGLSNQADVELDMINATAAADIAFIKSSSQALVNWLNALDQSDVSEWVWCIIIALICCARRSPEVTLICQHCGVKTSTVTPSFYYIFKMSLSCNINIPSFIGNLWWDLLLGNHLKHGPIHSLLKIPTINPSVEE